MILGRPSAALLREEKGGGEEWSRRPISIKSSVSRPRKEEEGEEEEEGKGGKFCRSDSCAPLLLWYKEGGEKRKRKRKEIVEAS